MMCTQSDDPSAYKFMPIEATDAMCLAAGRAIGIELPFWQVRQLYDAMVAVAPMNPFVGVVPNPIPLVPRRTG